MQSTLQICFRETLGKNRVNRQNRKCLAMTYVQALLIALFCFIIANYVQPHYRSARSPLLRNADCGMLHCGLRHCGTTLIGSGTQLEWHGSEDCLTAMQVHTCYCLRCSARVSVLNSHCTTEVTGATGHDEPAHILLELTAPNCCKLFVRHKKEKAVLAGWKGR